MNGEVGLVAALEEDLGEGAVEERTNQAGFVGEAREEANVRAALELLAWDDSSGIRAD